jgi:hypothetical protein
MKASVKGSDQHGKTHIHFNLDIIIFKEGESIIVYCPPMDLSGYGNTEKEAQTSFRTVLSEYFRYTLNKNTIKADLQRLGWKIKSSHKPIEPPTLARVLRDNENFSRIFNSYDFRKTVASVELPAIA